MILRTSLVAALACASTLAQTPAAPASKPATAQPVRARRPVEHPKQIQYPALNNIQSAQPERIALPNGMVVYLLEDRELPVLRASVLIRTGSRWDPPAKAGLSSIALRVMRTGGSAAHAGDDLDRELDRLGAQIEIEGGRTSARASMFVLKADADKGLGILADLLRTPRFPQDKIDLAKIDERDTISRRNDDPSAIAGRELDKLVYGAGSPYARHTEYETIGSLTRDDLAAFHREYFQPENVVLGVFGDLSAADMKSRVEKLFGTWPRGGRPKPQAPVVDPAAIPRGKLHLVNKDDVNQSSVRLAAQAVDRNHPDHYALDVISRVLSHRMFEKIRGEQGLAYMTGAPYRSAYDHTGQFQLMGGTKSGSTIAILESMRRELAGMLAAEVKPDEIGRAKDAVLKSAAFDSDSAGKIVERRMGFEYYGYPSDYLEKYRARIEKITAAELLAAAKTHLTPESFTTLVVGKGKDFEKPLGSLGQVAEISIAIPEPKAPVVAAATTETVAKARALFERAKQAHGGVRLDALKDYSARAQTTLVTPQGEFALKGNATVSLTGKSVVTMVTPGGEVVQGFDGEKAWAKLPNGTVQDAPASSVLEARKAAARETLLLLRGFGSEYTGQAIGASKLEGADVEGVVVTHTATSSEFRVFFDPKTGLVAGKSYRGSVMGAPGDMVEVYSDIRDLDGVRMPFRSLILRDGRKAAESRMEEIRWNPGAPESVYKKP